MALKTIMQDRNYYNKKIVIICVLFCFCILYMYNLTKMQQKDRTSELNYYITETSLPNSFDPLNADKSQNLPVMRLLFSTPIEISPDGNLYSTVLNSFVYNETTYQLTMSLKDNLYFYDNSKITHQDVVISILRMLLFRPDFPVIKHIKGKEEWLKLKEPLNSIPTGVSFDVNKNEIKINFEKNVPNCLFRLSLEIFSIIPTKMIDLTTGKLISEQIISSGPYYIEETKEKSLSLLHRKNVDQFSQFKYPEKIVIHYEKIDAIDISKIDNNTIISGVESDILTNGSFKSLNINWLASTRFTTLRFNPNIKPFDSKECRLFVSHTLRKYNLKYFPEMNTQASIFTEIMPGFKSIKTLIAENYNLTKETEKDCIELINKYGLKLESSNLPSLSKSIINLYNALKDVGVHKISITEKIDNNTIVDKFISNRLPVISGSSGFWPQDPVGDVEMYFTKNLHPTLTFLWNDKKLYEIIESIHPEKPKQALEKLNVHLFSESLLGVFAHSRRFYAYRNSDLKLKYHSSISTPAIWHLQLNE